VAEEAGPSNKVEKAAKSCDTLTSSL
jgi:hypothetical protein